jgi:cell division septum initiation protein DivIVA
VPLIGELLSPAATAAAATEPVADVEEKNESVTYSYRYLDGSPAPRDIIEGSSAASPDEVPTEPEIAAADEVEPDVVEPELVEPDAAAVVEPEAVEPEVAEPEAVEPESGAAASTEPEPIDEIVRVSASKAPERSKADDVFARLRAQRIDDVARLQEPPSTKSTLVIDRPEPAASSVAATEPNPATEPAEAIDAAAVVEARAAALQPIESSIAKKLKRVLADEQSSALDALRRKTKKTTLTFDEMVGATDVYVERYRAAIHNDLVAAGGLGVVSLVERSTESAETIGAGGEVGGHAITELMAELVIPLRERLERAFIDAGEQVEAAGDHFRAIYREWKTQRIDDAAANAARLAYGRGALAALTPGTPICWVVDPAHLCAEGDDNVLGGEVPAGSEFPTGHRSAPAYSGCRCAIALAHS